tara:strand:- start:286 stop:432 length:147 start_codon:yes stop_codon:yes gene_type:complete
VIDLTHKILYTWQVAGVGAGYIVNVFNYRLSGRAHPLKVIWAGPPGGG